ncbi:MAG: pentapeptide repeat-containing protein [Deltaproteobacteria bacterium]|nr:pentapeptide repeat-containing protein [Deltaproteobacteria bacterium]
MPPAGQCEALAAAARSCEDIGRHRRETCVERCEQRNTVCQDRMDRRNTAIVNASGCNRSSEPYASRRLAMSLVARCTAALGECTGHCEAIVNRPCERRNEASRACAQRSRQAQGQVARQLVVTFLAGDRNLSGRNLDGADLHGLDLHGVNLSGAHFVEANLAGANLAGANLNAAFLFNTNLAGANLTHANLSDASLSGVNFSNADMTGSDLSRVACDRNSTFTDAILAGARLTECPLQQPQPGAVGQPWRVCGEWCTCPPAPAPSPPDPRTLRHLHMHNGVYRLE